MADDKNQTTDNNITNILSAIQNWVVAQSNLTKQFTSVISSNHVNLFITGVSTTTGTVTTINTSIGLTGGPITTTGTLAVLLTKLTNSLSSDVSLSTSGAYFTGPTVAQGSSGTWLAIGQVTLQSTSACAFAAKLWDGTTVIDSGNMVTAAANFSGIIPLSGTITSPSSNIKISAETLSAVTGLILANGSGAAKDSTLTVVRIG